MNSSTDRTPVEHLTEGEMVQAVARGPKGKVIDADRGGWTIVQYHDRHSGGTMGYRHGSDRLIRCGS